MDAYIFSWLAPFPVAVGIFTVIICGFLAAIFIIGETRSEEDKRRFVNKSKHMSIAALIAAALVFVAARIENIPLAHWLFGNPVSIACVVLAIISLIWMWTSLFTRQTKLIRIIAGAQITLLLIAITYEHYPVLVNLKTMKACHCCHSMERKKPYGLLALHYLQERAHLTITILPAVQLFQ
ncbi:cytochrome d ubiquinol oxidase subunit II [Niabella sp. W65]|nr:cytochrome d ubiquinol oxidase subunit II [Niabella sp. W65]MCH7367037.1 cytochrome d ubiquinol oxidase subunit II [Niabella sp. W65]ULT42719.1 cytochrome d ubiquinol oxidase subunit II [Niabella sp. I65]